MKLTAFPPKNSTKQHAKQRLEKLAEELKLQQELLYANKQHSLLIILQGVDAAGKDGTIKKVFSYINPQGCNVKSFGVPSAEEQAHDFMWRAYPHFPAKGMIQIFNRSYYDEILVSTVESIADNGTNAVRKKFINQLEEYLQASNTIVLKFYLHVTAKEQEERIAKRLNDPRKKWKYDPADTRDAQKHSRYIGVYKEILADCNTVPWHVIPANKKWYRNLRVAEIIVAELKALKMKFPNHSTVYNGKRK